MIQFHAAMDDDFNTPEALAVLQGVARELNSAKAAGEPKRIAALASTLKTMGNVFGLLQQPPETYLRRALPASDSDSPQLTDEQIEALMAARHAARAARNFRESDRIRDDLAAAGIVLEDKPGGVSGWRRA